ncbi:GNAT family N-acetyltransferase [Gloeobacter kilaueensis]|uniref:GCN5-related N-acetyltransferase n=1 Tax=Gloeobacter kilaueensis (strain ATCC BAA-2537 / CCAP 1431/1 / ULC 316 / JS1) TaxID=1183438 RepID=U5QIV0_GLOK1|nr:GNAT family N-acetyltransferase [Gloeobacter kilaueensis]AGY58798.1 GCN5-related N-acetyltransferase [Gloeobacter kilaueensis JS1]
MNLEVHPLLPDEAEAELDALAAILIDVVAGGSSVSFVAPLSPASARAFWQKLLPPIRQEQILLLGARRDDQLVGTVQLRLDTPPNQPHRAEVAKLLVHRQARRLGLGRRLMETLEVLARKHGRHLLTLDTESGSPAEFLYRSLGYQVSGIIPRYALCADGTRLCDTTIYYKWLE